ncbi:replication factor C subunit 1 [Hetaerina americana]|uniref:replication factor C subunit 1 n=1 Tax=Hetaerina americana TaxID=62018 RepID=UPI003A7F3EC5
MSRDIRSYFGGGSTKARPLRISDDDTPQKKVNGKPEKATKKKKTMIIDSDDEEDPLPPSPKRKKQSNNSGKKKEQAKASVPTLKPVNISDIFGKNPVQRADAKELRKKFSPPLGSSPKKEEVGVKPAETVFVISDSSDEDDFAKSSRSARGNLSGKKGITSKKEERKILGETVRKVSLSASISPKKEESKVKELPIQNVETLSDSSGEEQLAKDSGKASGHSPVKKGMSSKKEVSLPVGVSPKKGSAKGAHRPGKVMEFLSDSSSENDIIECSAGDVPSRTLIDDRKLVQAKHSGKNTKPAEKGSHQEPVAKSGTLKSPLRMKADPEKAMKKEVLAEEKIASRQRKGSSGPETPQKEAEAGHQKSASKNDSMDESEKKKQRARQYHQYLHREGPRNPGSKEIPKGHPNCLVGLTFLITGVLESLDRDEAADLVQRCGGKVVKGISKSVNYIVLGEQPGPSKLEKAKKLGIKELTEDSLLDLVRTKTKEVEEESPSASSGERLGKRLIKEEEQESPAKRQKMNVEEPGKEKKVGLSRKLAYLSQNYEKPQMKIAKGSQAAAIKVEGGSCGPVKARVDESHEGVSSVALQDNSDSTMWVDKYKPTSVKQVIGQQGEKSNVNKLIRWLSNWQKYHGPNGRRPPRPGPWEKNDDGGFFKAALLSGAPGIGKTTSALLVCKELGMDAIELNASDTRSKKLLEGEVSELITNSSLSGYFKAGKKKNESKKKVLIMDEVDGMAGNEDRGGVAALIQLIKDSRIPIICICNDRAHPKIRSLVNHCYDLRFQRPRMEQIRGAMMSICFKEGVKVAPDALANLISSTNQDIRQVLHQLNMWSADKNAIRKSDGAPSTKRKDSLKDVRLGPWDVLRKVFSVEERRNSTINQQSDLFFYDYSLGPLFVFENYPKVSPKSARNLKDKLSLLAQTTESLAMGDIIQKAIRQNNSWKLLPAQAIFSSVIPGSLMEGQLTGQIDFPAFLGKTSTKGKMERLAQEISLHTRVATRATKESIKLDYLSYLRDAVISPLVKESQEQNRGGGGSGVHIREAIDVMQGYSLLREDLDSIMELTNFPGRPDPMSQVSSKVKAAFTRAYNKEGIMTPYSVTMTVKKKRGAGGSSEDFFGEEDEDDGFEDADEEEEEDIDTDAMIKIKKPSGRGGGQGGSKGEVGKGGSKKDNSMDGSKGKGRGRGGGRGGKKHS